MNRPVIVGGRGGSGDRKRRAGILRRAEIALGLGDESGAESLCRVLLASDPEHVGALEVLARALWRQGRYDELVATMRRLVAINAYDPGYHGLMAAAFACLGRYSEAIEAHRRCGNSESEAASEELQEWQAAIVAELIRADPVFKAHYAQNAYEACVSRGFRFAAIQTTNDNWLRSDSYAVNYGRPS